MNEQFDLASVIKGNLLPVIFGTVGLILISAGAVSLLFGGEKSSGLEFEAGGQNNEATSSAGLSTVVDIQGGVINPGVYSLPQGSRIHDLLVASGGLAETADREWAAKNLNLAAKLTDGQKIYIHRLGEQILEGTSATTGSSQASLIDINSASIQELDTLPGIGPVTAQKIVDQRPFASVSDLISKKTVSSSVFEQIKDKVTAN